MSDATIDERAGGAADEPDPRELWSWLGRALRPYLGWILIGLGALALVIGYFGVSREILVARQVPYFASGGLLGVSLVFIGGIALLIDDLRDADERVEHAERVAQERLDHIESAVAELRDVLLAHPDAPTRTLPEATERVALPGGSSYHRPDCRIVDGKQVEPVHDRGGLTPCKLCEPDAA